LNRRRRYPKIGVGCSVATASVMITAIRTTLQRQRQTINDQSVSLVARYTCNNRSKVTTRRKLFPAVSHPPTPADFLSEQMCFVAHYMAIIIIMMMTASLLMTFFKRRKTVISLDKGISWILCVSTTATTVETLRVRIRMKQTHFPPE